MPPRFDIDPKIRKFSMIAVALLLALTPYLFADNSLLALQISSAFLLLFVGIVFLTQRPAIMYRLISRKRHEDTRTSSPKRRENILNRPFKQKERR